MNLDYHYTLDYTSAHSITAKKATITRNARAKSQQPDTAGSAAGSVSLGSLNWAAAAHLVTNYLWVVGCSLGWLQSPGGWWQRALGCLYCCSGVGMVLLGATQFVAAAAATVAASRVELRSKLRNILLMQFSPGGNSPVFRFILEKNNKMI